MLTAKLKDGKEICLGFEYPKEALLALRKREDFFCPVCGERVNLKLGDQRIFHFAHKKGNECRDFYERESMYHLNGKRQLFQWLMRQKVPCKLEFYDQAIQQRPDVMFFYHDKKYALEFQCSIIPEEIFMKRTLVYLENGYIPLWILAANQLIQKKQNVWSLANFHYLFLKETKAGNFYIPTYSPEARLFNFIGPILSYSVKNVFAPYSLIPEAKLSVNTLVNPSIAHKVKIEMWHREVESYHFHWSLYRTPQQTHFFQEIYAHNLNTYLLPPEIGLPVYHSVLFQNSPIVWQTYVYLDLLSGKHSGEIISFDDIKVCLKRRIERKEIIIRHLPQFHHADPLLAIIDYLDSLARFGYLIKMKSGSFMVKRNLIIPKTNREVEEQKQHFYKSLAILKNV